jgi:2-methylcitrate dehydratase PrpD
MEIIAMKKPEDSSLDRRNFLKMAAAGAAARAVSVPAANARHHEPRQAAARPGADLMADVSAYISRGAEAELPKEVIEKAKHHILDTLAAMVSGSNLKPGKLAIKYIQNQGGTEEAQVVASKVVTSAINAAFANGMMAHADETDDSHTKTLVHPGSAVVPAALAMSEIEGAGGRRFLKSVVVGYDVGCRMILALDSQHLLQGSGATPGIGGCFGAASASAAVAGITKDLIPYLLSYAAQQASGINFWMRDKEHVEKAFVFGGMPARNGVTATRIIQSGFTGVSEFFSGEHNFFDAFSTKPDPRRLTEGLGREYEIMFTDMKQFPVGFPIQAPLDALLKLMTRHRLTSKNIKSIVARLPAPGVRTVNDRDMPDVNLQYILAATVIDGALTFGTAHSSERMNDPAVLEIRKRIVLMEEPELTAAKRTREAMVEVITNDGAKLTEHGISKGTVEHPMTREEVEEKSRELMTPVLGVDRSEKLIHKIWDLEEVRDMRELRPLLSVA